MGRFIPAGHSIGSSGFIGAKPAALPAGPTFMVVGTNTTNPNTANVPKAAWRDTHGTWHVIDATALGGRGCLGVTHFMGIWYLTTNAPGVLDSLLGTTADGNPPAAITAVVTGVPDHLTAIDVSAGVVVGSLFGNIITAPLNLSSFTINPANGPGSYVVLGVASNQDTP